MVPVGSIVGDIAAGVGLVGGLIAICGFLMHAKPVLERQDETRIRSATVVGGIGGFTIGCLIVVAQFVME
jgi:hypothetical protein